MRYRKHLLAATAGTGLLVAFASLAMPLDTLEPSAEHIVQQVQYDRPDGEHHRKGDHHKASPEADDDDDDDDHGGRHGGAMPPQNASPPANGLFAPGSRPTVQTN
ncbi:hypothetical protein [Rhizobium sp. FY34]|uniref:hypothetical protein n=1 Tax=Rhizobium sp. FY34 TaxID=2562309 RepID=UPI0010C13A83|nr:hypothetical protein [Rhizobium sp. FY34]